jgi:hypothetical protein
MPLLTSVALLSYLAFPAITATPVGGQRLPALPDQDNRPALPFRATLLNITEAGNSSLGEQIESRGEYFHEIGMKRGVQVDSYVHR